MSRLKFPLISAVLGFNEFVIAATSVPLDDLRGALDTSKCKDCVEDSFTFRECHHWNPNNQGLPVACKTFACTENIIYFAKCSPKMPSETSSCTQEVHSALSATQQVRALFPPLAPLPCGTDSGNDPATWPNINTIEGFPTNSDCLENIYANPGKGKCFIGSCPGNDVDTIDGRAYQKDRVANRNVCVW